MHRARPWQLRQAPARVAGFLDPRASMHVGRGTAKSTSTHRWLRGPTCLATCTHGTHNPMTTAITGSAIKILPDIGRYWCSYCQILEDPAHIRRIAELARYLKLWYTAERVQLLHIFEIMRIFKRLHILGGFVDIGHKWEIGDIGDNADIGDIGDIKNMGDT